MMKRAIRFAAIALLAGFLAGCYVMIDDGVGSVGIEMPDASSTGDPSPETLARIYLLNGTAMVPVGDDTPYKLVQIASTDNEVSIGPVPSGPDYQVILALGDNDEATGVFIPARYAVSDSFTVVAGQATPIDLTPVESKFSYVGEMLGMDLVGMIFAEDSFYTASVSDTGSTAYRLDPLNLFGANAVLRQIDLPDDQTATGIDQGADVNLVGTVVPWIDTTMGIIPYMADPTPANDSLNLTFFGDYPADAARPAVLSSGAFVVPKVPLASFPGKFDLFGWFQVDGGIGGVYDEDDSTTSSPKQWLTDIDLSAFIAGEPVSDLVVLTNASNEVDAYFASKLGAFRLPDTVLKDPEINTVPEILDEATFFEVTVDEQEAKITQLAYEQSAGKLWLGTNKGVVSVLTSNIVADATIDTSDVVTESLGRTVKDMAIGSNYQAILTDNFLIVSGPTTNYTAVPIYAGIVTAPTGLFLDDVSGLVLIAGETGIAAVDIDDL